MKIRLTAVMLSCVAVLGCGSDNGPGGTTLSTQERTSLSTALTNAGILDDASAAYSAFIFTQLSSYGTMSAAGAAATSAAISAAVATVDNFSAAGVQVKVVLTGAPAGSNSFVASGVIGWAGLNTGAQTVDQAITISRINDDTDPNFPSNGTANVASGDAEGSFYDRSTGSHYDATTGQVTLTTASFGSGSACPNLPAIPGLTFTCQVAIGTMNGNFSFSGTRTSGTGATTIAQPLTNFDVPAVRLTITFDASSFAATVAH